MAFTQFSYDMEIIAKLSDTPNVDDKLTAAQLKDKFDEGGKAIKTYINNTLLQEAVERPANNGMVKASGGKLVAAVAGTDYQAPIGGGDITAAMLADDAVTADKLASDAVKLSFENVAVTAAAFVADTTYADFPFRAAVALTGALATMTPEVTFSVADAMSGVFAPVAGCYDGGVYLYAAEVPAADITVPTVILWR